MQLLVAQFFFLIFFPIFRFMTGSENLIDVQPCLNNSLDCSQKVSLNFGGSLGVDACSALSGSVVVEFSLTCSEGLGAGCPLSGNETAQVTLFLNTGSACPVTDQIQFTTATLSGMIKGVERRDEEEREEENEREHTEIWK